MSVIANDRTAQQCETDTTPTGFDLSNPPGRGRAKTGSTDTGPDPMSSPLISYEQPIGVNVAAGELVAGMFILLLWILFFGAGLFVPTGTMRGTLLSANAKPLANTVVTALLVGVGYTLTNILFLASLASLLGCMAHRWQVGDGSERVPANGKAVASTRTYLSALLRGFFLYLTFLSGFLIVSTEDTVMNTEFAQYIRIAGMISVVAFIVGYDPNLLIRLMRRILSLANLPLEQTTQSVAGPSNPSTGE